MEQIKEKIFNDSFRRSLTPDQVPALLASLGFFDVRASDIKASEGGLCNTVFLADKYVVKVNTFNRFPFRVR